MFLVLGYRYSCILLLWVLLSHRFWVFYLFYFPQVSAIPVYFTMALLLQKSTSNKSIWNSSPLPPSAGFSPYKLPLDGLFSQILEGHLQHPLSGASTTYLCTGHLVKLFSCYHRTMSLCSYTPLQVRLQTLPTICSSIPITLNKDFIKSLPYVLSSLSEPAA